MSLLGAQVNPAEQKSLTQNVGRRTFLKVLGNTAPAAAIAACAPGSTERIIPYVIPPEDVIPGVATWYATVCGECPAGCGMVVRTREGRAVKVEGNAKHPINRGSLCVRGQASLQGLYNPDRFTGPQRKRITHAEAGQSVLEPIEWQTAQQVFVDQLRAIEADGRANRIAIITPFMTGALDSLVERWANGIGALRLRYEPFAYEAIRKADLATFGVSTVPQYDFTTPDLVVSFGADFLETWLSTVGYSRDYAAGRRRENGRPLRFVQFEPRMSLTGANADQWLEIEPGTEGLIVAAMIHTIISENRVQVHGITDATTSQIFDLVSEYAPEQVADRTGLDAAVIRKLAGQFSDPMAGPGRTLAVGGGIAATGETATATLVGINLLNYVAGNIGSTVLFDSDADSSTNNSVGWTGVNSHRDMVSLIAAMESGEIDLLLLHNVNPVHGMPGGTAFAAALANVPMVVSTSHCPDETSSFAHLILPTHTPLESWGDVESRQGVRGLMQPAMKPVFDTKHLGDLLLESGRALGPSMGDAIPESGDFLHFLRTEWRTMHARLARSTSESAESLESDFDTFWTAAQQRGGFWQSASKQTIQLNPAVLDAPLHLETTNSQRSFSLLVYPSLHMYDGRGANRAWLQEVPDPLMKTTWSSWAEVAPETAGMIGAEDGQLLTLESDNGTLDVTLLINAHLREGVVAMPLGQGHTQYGRYASGRGVNPTVLLDPEPVPSDGGPRWLGTRVDITPRAVRRPVARFQSEFDQNGRDLAQAVVRSDLDTRQFERESPLPSLYPTHPHPIHRWGMSIDLDACHGCNACVAACYAENNVPVLGADTMRTGRTMSWLRIDRFVEGNGDTTDNRFLPMLCQHCDHAPCESVCPTYATYHTDEGLNAQVYNRCVGTRYCANNCPYKVRRFNWSNPEVNSPLTQQLNPDVTTRVAGVMEKCTFCVQRIREGQDRSKDEKRSVRDGDITPACAQTCPATAIVFGDLNDPTSRVSLLADDARAYHVLGSLNTRPAVTYLRKVREG